MLGGSCIGAAFLYHRCVLETVGEYDANWFLVEDYEYWLRIASKHMIGVMDEVLYLYREHPQSLTTRKKAEIGQKYTELIMTYWEKWHDTFSYEERKTVIKGMIRALGLRENIDGLKAFAARECFDNADDKRVLKFFLLKYKLKQIVKIPERCLRRWVIEPLAKYLKAA